ncbi:hypothetical protein XELAEV_18000428mg [Xenopus laevis]|uniref:Uncharacterized protein n=1 Tax=Xenopus laevis TaxID=8355 RepID=A0A974GZ66_XENLA|nr:hypothetical protein XELAEV_18000428mg [Xenopus laevis]
MAGLCISGRRAVKRARRTQPVSGVLAARVVLGASFKRRQQMLRQVGVQSAGLLMQTQRVLGCTVVGWDNPVSHSSPPNRH